MDEPRKKQPRIFDSEQAEAMMGDEIKPVFPYVDEEELMLLRQRRKEEPRRLSREQAEAMGDEIKPVLPLVRRPGAEQPMFPKQRSKYPPILSREQMEVIKQHMLPEEQLPPEHSERTPQAHVSELMKENRDLMKLFNSYKKWPTKKKQQKLIVLFRNTTANLENNELKQELVKIFQLYLEATRLKYSKLRYFLLWQKDITKLKEGVGERPEESEAEEGTDFHSMQSGEPL